jgi:peptide/nickel transport system permease protein
MKGAAAELCRTVLKLVGSLLVISLLVFLLTVGIPGDPARAVLGKAATPSELVAFRAAHGLNHPLWLQYWDYLRQLLHGNLGTSYAAPVPVTSLVTDRLVRTMFLVLFGWTLAAVVSVTVGLATARRAGRWSDSVVSVATLVASASPEFMTGLLLIFVFGFHLGWLPVDSSEAGFYNTPWPALSSYVLPSIAIAFTIAPYVTRLTRANARDVISEPYIRAALLRGVGSARLTGRHVLPNAAPPVVNALALQFAGSIGGVVVTETVFGFPGVGQLLVQSVGERDLPVVQAIALIIGGAYVLTNVVADAVVRLVTPRLRAAQR